MKFTAQLHKIGKCSTFIVIPITIVRKFNLKAGDIEQFNIEKKVELVGSGGKNGK